MDTGGATEKEEIGVEWLDDHSCNVRCGTEDRAKAAMEVLGSRGTTSLWNGAVFDPRSFKSDFFVASHDNKSWRSVGVE